jgi:hypothetical protein
MRTRKEIANFLKNIPEIAVLGTVFALSLSLSLI